MKKTIIFLAIFAGFYWPRSVFATTTTIYPRTGASAMGIGTAASSGGEPSIGGGNSVGAGSSTIGVGNATGGGMGYFPTGPGNTGGGGYGSGGYENYTGPFNESTSAVTGTGSAEAPNPSVETAISPTENPNFGFADTGSVDGDSGQ
jgi:hypothetical protein